MSYPDARYLGDDGEIGAVYPSTDQGLDLTIGSSAAVRDLATGASTHGIRFLQPQVVNSATRSGEASASATTTTLSD